MISIETKLKHWKAIREKTPKTDIGDYRYAEGIVDGLEMAYLINERAKESAVEDRQADDCIEFKICKPAKNGNCGKGCPFYLPAT